MTRKATLLIFLGGLATCSVPAAMVAWDRSPAIETIDLRMVPDKARPGDRIRAVWTDKTLRMGNFFNSTCEGEVFRHFTGTNTEGRTTRWVFPPTRTAHHPGPIGAIENFSTPWNVPEDMMPGTVGTLHKDIHRGCNWLQLRVWPMSEHQEAKFMVAE
jgi:hypothetical protein